LRKWYAGFCPHCGATFIAPRPGHRFCSPGCRRRHRTYNRRQLQRARAGSPVGRAAIFQRDGWTCRLCGAPVDRTLRSPHPLAPSLDHIVPLSAGGTHEPANVQLAHVVCNVAKGSDRWPRALTHP
jgi:5-methylcytosine-specific restriction endonuclease McrA